MLPVQVLLAVCSALCSHLAKPLAVVLARGSELKVLYVDHPAGADFELLGPPHVIETDICRSIFQPGPCRVDQGPS